MIEQVISNPRSPLALREALGDVAPEIARIVPALRRLFPDIAQPLELPPELARRYLWNSFGEFVARGAQTQPLLLVLEDLHWAEDYTLLLTEYLAPLLPEMTVQIIGTYRDDEIDISHDRAEPVSCDRCARGRFLNHITSLVSSRAGEAPVDFIQAQQARQQISVSPMPPARRLARRPPRSSPGRGIAPAISSSAGESHRGGPGVTSG